MRLHTLVALASLPLLFASGASTQENMIHGCIKKNGTLKIVSGPGNCSSGETPISWNQAGPAGPEGPPGPTSSVRVFDNDGRDLGAYVEEINNERDFLRVLLEDLQLMVIIHRITGESIRPPVLHELPLCEGQAYTWPLMSNTVFADPLSRLVRRICG